MEGEINESDMQIKSVTRRVFDMDQRGIVGMDEKPKNEHTRPLTKLT